MEKEVIEGNKLIAEFYNFPYNDPEQFLITVDAGYGQSYDMPRTIEDLRYNTSWDRLIPVVEKIRDVEGLFTIGNTIDYLIGMFPPLYSKNFNSIHDLWLAVVEFIKWHNNQK